jgi:LacI family transcriptional regulator
LYRFARGADGVITRVFDTRSVQTFRRLKIPVVGVACAPQGTIPCVAQDHHAIGILAAEHLLERGFRRFAYCAYHGTDVSILRGKAFVEQLRQRGFDCDWFQFPNYQGFRREHVVLKRWIRKLYKPVGIFCVGDIAARVVTLAARDVGVAVPGEVGVLGVDNDEMIVRLGSPQLSSIDTGCDRLGFEAARMLQRLMEGRTLRKSWITVAPVRVVMRESTDIVTVEDAHVAEAVKFIHEHLQEGVNVKQLVQRMPMSRRSLEVAFRRHLGRTIHQEIVRARLQMAARLLEDGVLPLVKVSDLCGMRNQSRLNKVFRAGMGMTPAEYRKTHARKVF